MESSTPNHEKEMSLVNRIMFGGSTFDTINRSQIDISSITKPASQVGKQTSTGGAVTNELLSRTLYFRKTNILFIILFVSILCAVTVMNIPDIINIIFKIDDPDSNFEEEDHVLKDRWNKIIKYTFSFILVVIMFHIIILLLVMFFFVVSATINNNDPNISSFLIAKKHFTEAFWEYTDPITGNDAGLISYYMLLFLVLIGMFIFYILYTQLVKGYFSNIYYEHIYNENNPDATDLQQPQKYIYRYAVYILVMMLFVLFLLNYDKLMDNKVLFIYNTIFLIIYVILCISIMRFNMQRNYMKFMAYILLLLLVCLSYKLPLTQIAKYS